MRPKTIAAKWITFLVGTLILICAGAFHSGAAQEVSLSGWFHVIWGDSLPGPSAYGVEEYVVIDDQNRWASLYLGDASPLSHDEIVGLNHKRVRVVGQWQSARALARTSSQRRPHFQVSSIEFESSHATALGEIETAPLGISGAQRWVNILCRFADSTNITPRSKAYVQSLMGTIYPGMDHYWRESSYGNINLTGTAVGGWYNLPQPRSYYVYDYTGDGQEDLDFNRAAEDCTAAADADVFFPDFSGINLMFNQGLDCCAWGGSATLTRDGQAKNYRITWLPPWGYENQAVVAHEMGHGFGLPHSSGPYRETYDSRWDVMSNVWGNCYPSDPVFGCIGVHTISYHKDRLGWIPPSRSFEPAPGTIRTILLDRMGRSASGVNYHMVKIPIGGVKNEFYTVEARRFIGYDDMIPGEAVVIHRVDTTHSRPAQVVDVDNNGDPNDGAAMWLPGETFIDEANGVVVSVDAATTTGFQVTVMFGDITPPTQVVVTAPNTGEVVSRTITFKGAVQNNSGTIQKMEFYVDSDSSPACSAVTSKGSAFQCKWNTNSKPNGAHTVTAKTYDLSGSSIVSSPVAFDISNPFITLLTPRSGEDWLRGGTHMIGWTSEGVSGKVAIFLSRDGGRWQRITNTGNDGIQSWKVKGPVATQAKIRICSVRHPTVCDTSDGAFTIH